MSTYNEFWCSPEHSQDDAERLKITQKERKRALDQAWDYLLFHVLEAIPELEKHEWLRNQRLQEEWQEKWCRSRSSKNTSNDPEPSCVDWSSTTAQYIDC